MLSAKTVIVLGAGASAKFGFPVGKTLKQEIESLLTVRTDFGHVTQGDEEYAEYLRHVHRGTPTARIAAGGRVAQVSKAFASIDECLFTHSSDPVFVEVGKIAIAGLISRYEQRSFLARLLGTRKDFADAYSALSNFWPHQLGEVLSSGVKREHVDHVFDDLTFISFNYDRCAEVAMAAYISVAFDMSMSEAIETVKRRLKVHRPYGGLGDVETFGRLSGIRGFGAYQNLRVFTETIDDTSILDDIRASLREAGHIIFLGFACHPQNMSLMDISAEGSSSVSIYSSFFGEAEERIEAFVDRAKATFATENIRYCAGDCEDTLHRFRPRLVG